MHGHRFSKGSFLIICAFCRSLGLSAIVEEQYLPAVSGRSLLVGLLPAAAHYCMAESLGKGRGWDRAWRTKRAKGNGATHRQMLGHQSTGREAAGRGTEQGRAAHHCSTTLPCHSTRYNQSNQRAQSCQNCNARNQHPPKS